MKRGYDQTPREPAGSLSATLATMALGDAVRGVVRHPMRTYYVPIAAAALLGSSAFTPWIVVGDRRFGGVPDFAGLWVLALAGLAVVLACLSIATRKNSRHPLLLVGLFAFGVLLLGPRLLARTASQQGWANAQARAIIGRRPAHRTGCLSGPRRLGRHRPIWSHRGRQALPADLRGSGR
jgi:hypothetical protein